MDGFCTTLSYYNTRYNFEFNLTGLSLDDISSVIRQKGESQKGCFKKAKHEFPKNEHFLPPYT